MKFLVVSDIHAHPKAASWLNRRIDELHPDAVIVLGDITHFGPPEWAGQFLSQIKKKVYAVPGNCDPPGTVAFIEKNAISLHQKKMKIGGHVFIGFGGSNPTIFSTPFEISENGILRALEPLMEKGAIMVLHAPPLGHNDVPMSGGHVGSEAIARLVRSYRPLVVLAGHIHEDRGIVEDEGTLFINPGPAKEGYAVLLEIGDEITAEPLWRDLDH